MIKGICGIKKQFYTINNFQYLYTALLYTQNDSTQTFPITTEVHI